MTRFLDPPHLDNLVCKGCWGSFRTWMEFYQHSCELERKKKRERKELRRLLED